jgi:hypothetical protein
VETTFSQNKTFPNSRIQDERLCWMEGAELPPGFLNPAILLINVFIGWASTVLTRMKRVTWKGRHILTVSPLPR